MPEGLSEEVMETLPTAKVGWRDGAATVTGRQASLIFNFYFSSLNSIYTLLYHIRRFKGEGISPQPAVASPFGI